MYISSLNVFHTRSSDMKDYNLTAISFQRKRFSPFRKQHGRKNSDISFALKKLMNILFMASKVSPNDHGWDSVNHEMPEWLLNYSSAINRTARLLPVFAKYSVFLCRTKWSSWSSISVFFRERLRAKVRSATQTSSSRRFCVATETEKREKKGGCKSCSCRERRGERKAEERKSVLER